MGCEEDAVDAPPLHPNCRCTILPVDEQAKNYIFKKGVGYINTKYGRNMKW